jgi:hypothetical protein
VINILLRDVPVRASVSALETVQVNEALYPGHRPHGAVVLGAEQGPASRGGGEGGGGGGDGGGDGGGGGGEITAPLQTCQFANWIIYNW